MLIMAEKFSNYIDQLQEKGRYFFIKSQAKKELGLSEAAFKSACHRLTQKGRVVFLRKGFYLIVPLEYRAAGIIPASWFIDDLMKHLKHPYYVGLLSAAAIHGAAHQQPQEFQVISDRPLRPIVAKGSKISFFMKSSLKKTPVAKIKTSTGFMKVSTPEATALDLLYFYDRVGGLERVSETLEELAEKMDPQALLSLSRSTKRLPDVQRLGYLLEHLGEKDLLDPLASYIFKRKPRVTPLNPKAEKMDNVPQDPSWRLKLNQSLESLS